MFIVHLQQYEKLEMALKPVGNLIRNTQAALAMHACEVHVIFYYVQKFMNNMVCRPTITTL